MDDTEARRRPGAGKEIVRRLDGLRNMKRNYLVQAWLVLTLAVAFGAALAGVQSALSEKIEQNKKNETLNRAPSLVGLADEDPEKIRQQKVAQIPGADAYNVYDGAGKLLAKVEELTIDVEGASQKAYKAYAPDGKHVGWVIRAAGNGFNDKIELLIGLDAEAGRITGLYVLDQKETPELGNKITEKTWRDQFSSRERQARNQPPLHTAKKLAVTKGEPGENEIRAVTAATVSSNSVCQIVNDAVAKFKDALARMGGEDPMLLRIPEVVPGAKTGRKIAVAELTAYEAADASGKHIGWAVIVSGKGYAGTIELLIGLDASAERLTGLVVLSHKETIKEADRIVTAQWRQQFAGKSATERLSIVKEPPRPDGNEIRAVTGATRTSKSVCNIINEAVAKVRGRLAALARTSK